MLPAFLAAALVACTDAGAPSRQVVAPAPPSTVVAALDPSGLEPLVLVDAPTGFSSAADEVGGTGATDLDAAAADTGDPAAAAALADAGFTRGWQRLWVGDGGEDELFLLVYEFADAAGAEAFLERMAGDVAAGGEGVFEVPTLPEAVGISAGGDGLAVTAVTATTDRYLVQVIGDGPAPGPSRGTVVALATAQVARLR